MIMTICMIVNRNIFQECLNFKIIDPKSNVFYQPSKLDLSLYLKKCIFIDILLAAVVYIKFTDIHKVYRQTYLVQISFRIFGSQIEFHFGIYSTLHHIICLGYNIFILVKFCIYPDKFKIFSQFQKNIHNASSYLEVF